MDRSASILQILILAHVSQSLYQFQMSVDKTKRPSPCCSYLNCIVTVLVCIVVINGFVTYVLINDIRNLSNQVLKINQNLEEQIDLVSEQTQASIAKLQESIVMLKIQEEVDESDLDQLFLRLKQLQEMRKGEQSSWGKQQQSEYGEKMSEIMKNIQEWMKNKAQKISQNDFQFEEKKQKIKQQTAKVFQTLRQKKDQALKGIGENWQTVKEKSDTLFKQAKDKWEQVQFKQKWQSAKEKSENFFNEAKQKWEKVELKQKINQNYQKVKGATQGLWNSIKSTWGSEEKQNL